MAEPYGPARQRAAERALSSGEAVEKSFAVLYDKINLKGLTGEKEHDEAILAFLKDEHNGWHEYSGARCNLEVHIFVYPSDSLLARQEFNSCIARMNKERFERIDEIKKGYFSQVSP